MQHTLLRAKIIFLKNEMGYRRIKCNSFYENYLKHVYLQFERQILACFNSSCFIPIVFHYKIIFYIQKLYFMLILSLLIFDS